MFIMQAKKGYWLSKNPAKAAGEKFFLIYTFVWIVLMGVGIVLGLPEKLNDAGMIVMAAVISVPIVLVPIFFMRDPGKKWYQTYCFKANLFIFILSFFQNYVLTHYFFDVLGMVYSYPTVTSHLEAALIGKSGQPVPLIMYFYTQCFYMTYHVTAIVALRRLCTIDKPVIQKLRPVFFALAGLFWALMETVIMSKVAGTTFWYKDVSRMMKYGTFIYAFCFFPSFPMFYCLDEKREWSVGKTATMAFASNAITLLLFDFATQIVGHI